MEYVEYGQKKIPVVASVDVVVAGGGCAGVGAAIAAARYGAKTLLIERMFSLGGMMTCGLMSKVAISPTNNGLAVEILKRLDTYQGTHYLDSRPEVPIDPESMKILLDRMVSEESGVDVRFGTVLSDVVIAKDRQISAVIIENIDGTQAVEAKYFIDCTGDGQLGFKAGASWVQGNDKGYSSSPTLMFRVGNCEIEKLMAYMEANPTYFESVLTTYSNHKLSPAQNRKNIAQDRYAHFADFVKFIKMKADENPGMFSEWDMKVLLSRGLIFMNQPKPGHVLVNSSRISLFKGDDSIELSEAMRTSRKQVEVLFKFMKTFLPGFENSFIMDTGSLLGIRESRRLTGDYMFTEGDVHSLARFDDAIVSNHGGVEIHSTNGIGTDIRELDPSEFYHVPYRAIISRDFDNLFMAGRCFSANHAGLSAARNIAYCTALGQAAGTASAKLVSDDMENVRAIDIKWLQSELKAVL